MESLKNRMNRLQNGSSPNRWEEVSIVPRGTSPAWLTRWQLAATLKDRLEMIYGPTGRQPNVRLLQSSRNYRELVRRYSNESML